MGMQNIWARISMHSFGPYRQVWRKILAWANETENVCQRVGGIEKQQTPFLRFSSSHLSIFILLSKSKYRIRNPTTSDISSIFIDCLVTWPDHPLQVKGRLGTIRKQSRLKSLEKVKSIHAIMESMPAPTAGAPSRYGRACSNCARAKAKCDTGNGVGAKCGRCLVCLIQWL